jgi:chloride intracellular channel protein 2
MKQEYHAQPPVVVLVQENIVLTDNLRIEQYINSRFTSLDLTSDKESENVCSDLYIKLNAYLKATDSTVQAKERLLLMELKRINDFLEERNTKFLSGNEMTLIDCDVMPKLQHIRIACKAYRNFEIPTELDSLWRYMANCYETKAFKESCPYDQDIILHYEGKVSIKPLGKNPTLQRATSTTDVPDLTFND